MMTDKEKFISQIRTSQPLSGEFDLRAPLYVTLSLYQDYEWTIVAEQPIEPGRSPSPGRSDRH